MHHFVFSRLNIPHHTAISSHVPCQLTGNTNNNAVNNIPVKSLNNHTRIDHASVNKSVEKNHQLIISLLNPCSVVNKPIMLHEFIVDSSSDVIAVTETWMHETEADNVTISAMLPKEYKLKQNARSSRGGGVALIHRENIDVKKVKPMPNRSFEMLECLVNIPKNPITVIVVYRPPPSQKNKLTVNIFLEEFAEYLEHLIPLTGKLLILGDFNFHIDDPFDAHATRFINLMSSFGLKQHVSEATHKKGHILDLCFTRDSESLVTDVTVQDYHFPDHYPVIIHVSAVLPNMLNAKEIQYRKLNSIDIERFTSDIDRSLPIYLNNNMGLVIQLENCLLHILDQHAPLRTVTVINRTHTEWYTDNIREQKQKRRQYERLWRKTGLTIHKDMFNAQRIKTNNTIAEAKRTYYNNLINDTHGDSKKLFSILNKLLGRTKPKILPENQSIPSLLDTFSNYFIEKISTIRLSIPTTTLTKDIILPIATHSFDTFTRVSPSDIKKIIMSSPNKSCNLDVLPTTLLKKCIPSEMLLNTITTVINKSLSEGVFPQKFKHALVTPLIKKASLDPNNLKSYRPVSNLSFLSKILERIVASQLDNHLERNKLHEPFQSAYRQQHSTETALLRLHNDIQHQLGCRKSVMLVLLDLSAAFDTIDHCKLLSTMEKLGITGKVADWFKSYLSLRKQAISIDGKNSEEKQLSFGVPQGSVLGPKCYLIYVTALGQLLREHHINYHLYADDTQLYISFDPKNKDNTSLSIEHLENVIQLVKIWMNSNMLKMNDNKTEVIVIHPKCNLNTPSPSLKISGTTIEPSTTVRNLGVTLDTQLSMDKHISNICSTAHLHLHSIGKIRSYLTKSSTERIVHALITSRLDYCNSLLYGLPASKLNRLQRVQNAAARLITRTRKRDHITPVLYDLHWLPIAERIEFKLLLLVFKVKNNLAPHYLSVLLKPYQPMRQLRSVDQELFTIPSVTSTYHRNSFAVAGPLLWNNLPFHVRSASTLEMFKSRLKTFLFNRHYHT